MIHCPGRFIAPKNSRCLGKAPGWLDTTGFRRPPEEEKARPWRGVIDIWIGNLILFATRMKQILIFLLLAVASPLVAGSADAVIRGKTESGRTELEIRVGDIDGLIRSVKLTVDGESYLVDDAEAFPQSVIRDNENGIYVLVLDAGERKFRFWMVPGSEKINEQGPGVFRSRFAAVLEATDPRKENHTKMTPRITIGCTLEWET
jgi:hypothetical protein